MSGADPSHGQSLDVRAVSRRDPAAGMHERRTDIDR